MDTPKTSLKLTVRYVTDRVFSTEAYYQARSIFYQRSLILLITNFPQGAMMTCQEEWRGPPSNIEKKISIDNQDDVIVDGRADHLQVRHGL